MAAHCHSSRSGGDGGGGTANRASEELTESVRPQWRRPRVKDREGHGAIVLSTLKASFSAGNFGVHQAEKPTEIGVVLS